MFTAALFTVAWTCRQPKCPSMEAQIKRMFIYTYIHIYKTRILPCHKKNGITSLAATWKGAEIVHTESSKSEKDKYYMILFIHEILKNSRSYSIFKIEIESQM